MPAGYDVVSPGAVIASDPTKSAALKTGNPKHQPGTNDAELAGGYLSRNEADVFGRFILISALAIIPAGTATAQISVTRRLATCRCEPDGKPRKPRLLLPIAGGLGFLPVSIAARDSQLPTLAFPSLVDIRDVTPRNALEGERELAVGALAPDTATALPTLMVIAAVILSIGVYLVLPTRRRRRARAAWRPVGTRARGGWRVRTIYKRRVGGVLAASGGLLLLLGSREYAEGAEAQREARAKWLQMGQTVIRADAAEPGEASGLDAEGRPVGTRSSFIGFGVLPATSGVASVVPLPLVAMSGREIRRGSPVARLLIPAIGLDEIVMEGVGPIELNGGPGHFPGSVLPGDSGNAIVSAHRDRHFRRMAELVVGSRIRTETRTGATDWIVTERRVVSRDTPALFEASEATLTLTTCWPIRYFGSAPDRLLIVAKPAVP
jgi:LPXTG-site transpeptidase (sortase) family protein